jgi:hypothetical protein
MALVGALSNPRVQGVVAEASVEMAAVRAGDRPVHAPVRKRSTRRRGEVRSVIVALLERHGPMQAREIHRAVERELHDDVPWSSIANCLARLSDGPDAELERIGPGCYRLNRGQ